MRSIWRGKRYRKAFYHRKDRSGSFRIRELIVDKAKQRPYS